ncbi:hypothetical protein ACFE04_008570 [Oxalis oulophora]
MRKSCNALEWLWFDTTNQESFFCFLPTMLLSSFGVSHLIYNNGQSQLVFVSLVDQSNFANQLDQNYMKFFLAGNPQEEIQDSQSVKKDATTYFLQDLEMIRPPRQEEEEEEEGEAYEPRQSRPWGHLHISIRKVKIGLHVGQSSNDMIVKLAKQAKQIKDMENQQVARMDEMKKKHVWEVEQIRNKYDGDIEKMQKVIDARFDFA